MDNFNLKNFILENKLARGSKLIENIDEKEETLNEVDSLKDIEDKIREALRDALFISKDGKTMGYLNKDNSEPKIRAKRYDEVIKILEKIIGQYKLMKGDLEK
jgi:hypothetical protein